jgi:Outer membrane protein beta-barrel domain
MNDKEPFEDIIASKFSEAEFPFDEANWDAAEEMISSHRTKEKRRRIGFIFLSGIALGIIAMLPFVIKLNDDSKTPIAEHITAPIHETITNNTLIVETQTKNSTGHELANNNITTSETNTESRLEKSPAEKNISKDELKKEIADELGKVKNTHPSLTTAASVEKLNDADKIIKPKRTNKKHIAESSHISFSTGFKLNNNVNAKPIETKIPETEDLQLPQESKCVVLNKLEQPTIPAIDSLPNIASLSSTEKLDDVLNKKGLPKPWSVTAAFGGNFVNGFTLSPIQGLEVSKGITPRLEIGTGAYYTYLSLNSGNVKAIVMHTNYDFGYQSDVTEIKTNKLHYVVIPVYAKYNVNDKNTFIAGANIFALFTASNSYNTYSESYGQKTNLTSKKASGYANGINNYDIGVLLGYKRKLFGNLGAALYFNYGLMDIKKNAYYNQNKFDRNVSAQFMLTYKL